MKISWSGASASKATIVHTMTHPIHTLAGRISSGTGKAGVIVVWLQHKDSGAINGRVGIMSPDE